jgi:drug/metabolite transporter superfamily protein YnfA
MTAAIVARSVALFALAGLLEIGGGYLVWLWLRDARSHHPLGRTKNLATNF